MFLQGQEVERLNICTSIHVEIYAGISYLENTPHCAKQDLKYLQQFGYNMFKKCVMSIEGYLLWLY